jgi:hypothetical protein
MATFVWLGGRIQAGELFWAGQPIATKTASFLPVGFDVLRADDGCLALAVATLEWTVLPCNTRLPFLSETGRIDAYMPWRQENICLMATCRAIFVDRKLRNAVTFEAANLTALPAIPINYHIVCVCKVVMKIGVVTFFVVLQ